MTKMSFSRLQNQQKKVLIVGGGPVGLVMGYLLEKIYQIPTRIIEKQLQPTSHPQAHFLNLRTMEILYTMMPEFHDRLLKEAAPSSQWRDYIYATGVSKEQIFGRIDQFGPNIPRPTIETTNMSQQQKDAHVRQALDAISPTQFLHFPQNRFEALLSNYLKENDVHLERGIEVEVLEEEGGGGGGGRQPQLYLHHRSTGEKEQVLGGQYEYIIGADGAHSLIRQWSGIQMIGKQNLQSLVNVHFTCQELTQLAKENPAMLYFIFNAEVVGVLIAHDLTKYEWVLQIPFFPPYEKFQEFTETFCQQLVLQLLTKTNSGSTNIQKKDVHILSIGQWQMSARVASSYYHQLTTNGQHVFLVGDAAHQFPPAGGFGMNTGIQDAHNLAWKIQLTSESDGQSSLLLQSYDTERRPIGLWNTKLSLQNVERTMRIPSALGASYQNAHTFTQMMQENVLLPFHFQKEIVHQAMYIGKKHLSLLPKMNLLIKKVQEMLTQRTSIGMLFYHFDIGFNYTTTKWTQKAKSLLQEEQALNDACLFQPVNSRVNTKQKTHIFDACVDCLQVGARFPHFWIQELFNSRPQMSTLSLPVYLLGKYKTTHVMLIPVKSMEEIQFHLTTTTTANKKHRNIYVVFLVDSSTSIQMDPNLLLPEQEQVSIYQIVSTGTTDNMSARRFYQEFQGALIRPDGHIAHLWSTQDPLSSSSSSLDNIIELI